MNNIEDIVSTIGDVGVLVVIAAIFLYTAIRLINLFIKYVETKVKDRKHDKLLDLRGSINRKIYSLLDQFIDDTDGARVQVLEFSNSVTSVAYLPFKFMSCTYEVCSMGSSSLGSRIDKLSTSLFTPFFTHLYQEPYCIVDINKPLRVYGGAIYDAMSISGESKSLCAILKTASGKSLGIVMLKQEDDFTDYQKDSIQVLADKLSALLGIMDK